MAQQIDQRHGRDRLRELLDAVLDEDNWTLGDMAGGAHASAFHFARQVSRGTGEPPVAMRRRVMLERAAWQIRQGGSVTDAAFAAGYDSVEGFSRAFARAYGHPPSQTPAADGTGHWLPAPNGIHFHPPASLWVQDDPVPPGDEVTELMVRHDVDDTVALLALARELPEEAYRRVRHPGHVLLSWDGPEESVADLLAHHVRTKEVWLAAIEGADMPPAGGSELDELIRRHDAVAPRWLATIRAIDRRGAWGDRLVDALCDPPESFVLGGVVAHVLTFAAVRRQLVRQALQAHPTTTTDDGDPIRWMRRRTGGET